MFNITAEQVFFVSAILVFSSCLVGLIHSLTMTKEKLIKQQEEIISNALSSMEESNFRNTMIKGVISIIVGLGLTVAFVWSGLVIGAFWWVFAVYSPSVLTMLNYQLRIKPMLQTMVNEI